MNPPIKEGVIRGVEGEKKRRKIKGK